MGSDVGLGVGSAVVGLDVGIGVVLTPALGLGVCSDAVGLCMGSDMCSDLGSGMRLVESLDVVCSDAGSCVSLDVVCLAMISDVRLGVDSECLA